MARTTRKELEDFAEQMALRLQLPLRISSSSGFIKLVRMKESGAYDDFSGSFLTNTELWFWMDAFMKGFDLGQNRQGVLEWFPQE